MSRPRATTAVFLAAGEGSRLRADGALLPKPLTVLGGLPLLERGIRNATKAGIERFVVVLGHRGDEIRAALEPRLQGFDVQWVENPHWPLGNGTSVIAARLFAGSRPALVMMSDHLVFASTLSGLLDAAAARDGSVLAVDRKRGTVVDEDDAMKVRIAEDRIVAIHKTLDSFDAIDVGAAVFEEAFFDELEAVARRSGGRVGHGEGMAALAAAGALFAHDIGEDVWEDVDTEEARRAAEGILYDSLRKSTDGYLSRMLERRLSLAVTRRLAQTNITPNQVSAGIVVIGAIAAALFAGPSRLSQMLGAVVFWCASFLDGCDGEIARLKFLESRLGGWIDLWVDNLVHCMVFFGMGVGLHRASGDQIWLVVGGVAVVGVLLSAGWASWQTSRAARQTLLAAKGGGPLFVSVFGSFERVPDRSGLGRLRRLADVLSRRDFIFGTIFLTAFGLLPWLLWAAAIGANFFFLVLVSIEFAERRTSAAKGRP